ncbi:carbonic anhydrase [Crepidotus variabilis]|uniref:Carbonic anhydrase n=1 Tax=Crepidotus variabilis TaxID=179855 RepID=A0A9P6EGE5_9AGAR|nr:carbonic anhydrase [Crepidotus variabilis]
MHLLTVSLVLAAISGALAHPTHHLARREVRIIGSVARGTHSAPAVAPPPSSTGSPIGSAANSTVGTFETLVKGNQKFRDEIKSSEPELLKKLTDEGQSPPFMFLGCSDSRVSEGTIFNAKPGTLFTQRNIANQFQSTDPNAQSVLSYAVAELGVQHVLVVGHYGCGGVAASIVPPPAGLVDAANGAVQSWIQPVREIFATSSRPEIVELRGRINSTVTEEPEVSDPGFRALVEENVKASVKRITSDSVISNHFTTLATEAQKTKRSGTEKALSPVFVHGWVYDIENGEIRDLGVSVGPPGVAIPPPPFEAVAAAGAKVAGGEITVIGHSTSTTV